MNRSMIDKIAIEPSVVPAVYAASADGLGVDLQGANSAQVEVATGANVGTFTGSVVIQESGDNSSFADAPASAVLGTVNAATANSTGKIAYIGTKRYIRARVVKTGGTSIALSATVVKGYLSQAPDGVSYPS